MWAGNWEGVGGNLGKSGQEKWWYREVGCKKERGRSKRELTWEVRWDNRGLVTAALTPQVHPLHRNSKMKDCCLASLSFKIVYDDCEGSDETVDVQSESSHIL